MQNYYNTVLNLLNPTTRNSGQPEFKKGPWTLEEDDKLIAHVTSYGIWNWNMMAKSAGLSRSGQSCRHRWLNYLRPNVKRGNFTEDEDRIITLLHSVIGEKWSTIATHVPGRTEYQIERYWHTRNSMPPRKLMPSRNLMQGNRTFLFEDEHMNVYEIGGDNINTISYSTTHQTESESSYSVSFNSHGISSVSSKWSTTNHASSNYLTHATQLRDKNKSMDMEESSGSFEASKLSQV